MNPRPAAATPDPVAPTHESAPVDTSDESVAGEEDPGVALDLGIAGNSSPPAAAPSSPPRNRAAAIPQKGDRTEADDQ